MTVAIRRFVLLLLVTGLPFFEQVTVAACFPQGGDGWGYSKFLQAMQEPTLFERPLGKDVEQYRFLWLRTFHKPIAVRIWKDGAGSHLRVVRLSGKGGYKTGQLELDQSFAVTNEQWTEFTNLIEQASFWDAPMKETDVIGADGAQWVLEGGAGERYHVVDRWCPLDRVANRPTADFVACCRYLLALSKQTVPQKETY